MAKQFLAKAGGGLTKTFGFIFKLKLLFFFLLFIIINSAIIGISEKSFAPVIEDLGERFLTPTLQIQQFSIKTIENQGVYQATEKFWGGVWNFISDMWSVLTQFYIILIWISVLAFLISASPLSDRSRVFVNWTLAIFLFIVFQMLYISFTNKGSIFTPFWAFKDFFIALQYYISPVVEFGEKIYGSENMTNIINQTNVSVV